MEMRWVAFCGQPFDCEPWVTLCVSLHIFSQQAPHHLPPYTPHCFQGLWEVAFLCIWSQKQLWEQQASDKTSSLQILQYNIYTLKKAQPCVPDIRLANSCCWQEADIQSQNIYTSPHWQHQHIFGVCVRDALQSLWLLAILPAITNVNQVTDQWPTHTSMWDAASLLERLKNNFRLLVLYFFDTVYDDAAGHLKCLFIGVLAS